MADNFGKDSEPTFIIQIKFSFSVGILILTLILKKDIRYVNGVNRNFHPFSEEMKVPSFIVVQSRFRFSGCGS
jgi:hypothetical protein